VVAEGEPGVVSLVEPSSGLLSPELPSPRWYFAISRARAVSCALLGDIRCFSGTITAGPRIRSSRVAVKLESRRIMGRDPCKGGRLPTAAIVVPDWQCYEWGITGEAVNEWGNG
jgi:hypothetical protein